MNNKVKALFIRADKPYKDFGDILQIGRAEGCKVLGVNKVRVLNVIMSHSPPGYIVLVSPKDMVVQMGGGNQRKRVER